MTSFPPSRLGYEIPRMALYMMRASERDSRKVLIPDLKQRLRDSLRTVVETYISRNRFAFVSADKLKNFASTVDFIDKQVTYNFRPKGAVACPAMEAAAGRSLIEMTMRADSLAPVTEAPGRGVP